MLEGDVGVELYAVLHGCFVEHHQVGVVGGSGCRVGPAARRRGTSWCRGSRLQHVGEVFSTHDRVRHAVHIAGTEHLSGDIEGEICERGIVRRNGVSGITSGVAVAPCASAIRSATRRS